MKGMRLARTATLVGYSLLVVLIIVWHGWLHPPERVPRLLVVGFVLAPLLFPLSGILHGRAYTHAWASLIALIYFTLGFAHAAVQAERLYGVLQIGSSLIFFFGCIVYARLRTRAERGTPARQNPGPPAPT